MPLVDYQGEVIEFPDDMSEEDINAALASMDAPAPTGDFSPMSILGEAAAAGNRAVMETLDFLGPGTANAALRLAGSDYQLPTFGGAFAQTPGAAGGFMPEGTAQEVVQGLGATLPAAGSLVPAVGRNLGTVGGAAAELLGFGSAGPAPQAAEAVTGAVPMARRAQMLDWPLSPGDITGNQQLKRIESAIESTAMPANPALRMAGRRQQMINEAAQEALGLPSGTPLTSETVGDVAEGLSERFRRLGDIENIPVGEGFVDELVGAQEAAQGRLFSDPDIGKTIDRVFDRVTGEGGLSVSDYQDMSSELKAKIRQAWKGESPDPNYAETLGQIVETLDRAAIEGVSPAVRADLKDARNKWRVLSSLEKSRAIHESGDVSGPLLANYLRRTDKSGYGRGRNAGRLYETARMSKAFPYRSDSGTADRLAIQNIMTDPVAGLLSGVLRSPLSAAANAYYAGAPLAPRAVRAAAQAPVGITARFGGMLEGERSGRDYYEEERGLLED